MNEMNESIFKAYDIRGIYPTDINGAVVEKIVPACLGFFDGDKNIGNRLVVIAHDGRHGSVELAATARAGLLKASGDGKVEKLDIREIGLATAPMFYFLVVHFRAAGGIMITASHNPKEYNGMKVVRRDAELIAGTDILAAYKK